jgi:hypothetical protein
MKNLILVPLSTARSAVVSLTGENEEEVEKIK